MNVVQVRYMLSAVDYNLTIKVKFIQENA